MSERTKALLELDKMARELEADNEVHPKSMVRAKRERRADAIRFALTALTRPDPAAMSDEERAIEACGLSLRRVPPPHVVDGALELCRESFPNDGAEGESVHVLCDAVEHLRAALTVLKEGADHEGK